MRTNTVKLWLSTLLLLAPVTIPASYAESQAKAEVGSGNTMVTTTEKYSQEQQVDDGMHSGLSPIWWVLIALAVVGGVGYVLSTNRRDREHLNH